jgi:hypothetical protein
MVFLPLGNGAETSRNRKNGRRSYQMKKFLLMTVAALAVAGATYASMSPFSVQNAREALSQVQELSDQVGAIPYGDMTTSVVFDPMFTSQMGLNDLIETVHYTRDDLAKAMSLKTLDVVAAADMLMQPNLPTMQTAAEKSQPCLTSTTCTKTQD